MYEEKYLLKLVDHDSELITTIIIMNEDLQHVLLDIEGATLTNIRCNDILKNANLLNLISTKLAKGYNLIGTFERSTKKIRPMDNNTFKLKNVIKQMILKFEKGTKQSPKADYNKEQQTFVLNKFGNLVPCEENPIIFTNVTSRNQSSNDLERLRKEKRGRGRTTEERERGRTTETGRGTTETGRGTTETGGRRT